MKMSNQELQDHILSLTNKISDLQGSAEIYEDIKLSFCEYAPLNFEGIYCFSDKKGYHYACVERGEVMHDNITHSVFEISYWVLRHYISDMASRFEKLHRVKDQDYRRIWFNKELEIFGALGGNFRKRAEIDIDEILKESPYNDLRYKNILGSDY